MFEKVLNIALEFWDVLGEMSPFLLFGFFVAGMISVFISPATIRKHLGGRKIWPITKASLFGIPLPLCSCGVIPVTTSLRKHGASKGASVSFLLSTPQTGVDSLAVTYSLLGPAFTIIRPITTFLTGLIGGLLVELFDPTKQEPQELKCECHLEKAKPGLPRLIKGIKYGMIILPRDVSKAMLLGVAVAALISAFVPSDFFAEKLGRGILPMLAMMVLGIPVYVCSSASVPIAAVLLAKGLTPGAVLVFLMTGPATNAASFFTIWSALGRKTAIIYILTVAVCSILFGLMIDYLAFEVGVKITTPAMWMMPAIIKNISALILLTLLGYGMLTKKTKH